MKSFVQVVAGGDGAARAVDADHDGLHSIILGRGFDLLLRVRRQPFQQNPVDLNDGDAIMSALLARMMVLVKGRLAVRKHERHNEDKSIPRDRGQKNQDKSSAEQSAPKRDPRPRGRPVGRENRQGGRRLRIVRVSHCRYPFAPNQLLDRSTMITQATTLG